MTAERWQRVKSLLNRALELPPPERRRFLEKECGPEQDLEREVLDLLSAHEASGDFLNEPALPTTSGISQTALVMLGRQIGPYRLVREIGRGGMGTVHLAFRVDDESRRYVAVKVLRRGLDSEFILKRFRFERQILATLEHPNIARVEDAGTTEEGFPYFVMEYIDGLPLDRYCDEHRLSTSDRLRIFLKICAAVHYAHQHQVIHRDIKPANILVNAAGEPKLLDFGIAKILDASAWGETVDATVTQMRMLTPEYASPEQVRGEPVSAASDVYSLGVLLYELLSGHRPYRTRSRVPHEVAQAVCEEQPERPSTIIKRVEQTTRGGDTVTISPESVSEARGTDPVELRRSLSGDLDTIVLVAMRKEPERRFGTVKEFGNDLLRHMEGRPIHARRDTVKFRTSRLVRRHRRAVVFAVAGAALALAATALVLRQRESGYTVSPRVPLQSRPLTTYAGDESQADFSPDGKRIAFVWNGGVAGSAPDVYVRTLENGAPVQVTRSPADDRSPAWSPDGREIAFLRSGRNESGFYIVRADGSGERRIAESSPLVFERLGRQLEWSRSGRSLYVVDRYQPSEPFAIQELNVATGSKRRITSPPGTASGDVALSLSPDGQHIAFIRVAGSGVSDVFVQPLSGGPERRLTNDNLWISSVTWSADGKDLVFATSRIGNPTLWRIPAGGGLAERITEISQNSTDPAFAPDGKRLIYSHFMTDSNVWRADIEGHSGPQQLLVSTQYDASPSYSPDGSRIAFRSNRGGTNEIWIAEADGSNATQLTRYGGVLTGTPRWSPDGEWIAYDSRPEGIPHIYVISPEGGEARKVTTDTTENVVPSWSRDSKWVYFGSNHLGVWQIWKKAIAGGPAVQVTRHGGFAGFESPDGKHLYYAKARNVPGLWRMPVDRPEEEVELVPELKPGYWGYWAISRRGLFYVDKPSLAMPALIYLMDPQTRRRSVIAEVARPLTLGTSAFTVSPDERYVLYAQQDFYSSDLMLAEPVRPSGGARP
jgi:Tol biopolymer transport system component/serine/threonine protein kinase